MGLSGKRVLVAVGGGIAAFKAVELVRELTRRGAETRVVMTEAATHFVGPVTFAGLTGKPAVTDLWDPTYAGEVHVELGAWADAIVVLPATLNLIARASVGLADDAVLATLACARGRVLFAPAMHTRMWQQPSTRAHVETLTARGAGFVGPVWGALASGEEGEGRLAEPAAVADAVERALEAGASSNASATGAAAPLAGKRVLITAGGTREPIDPVRFIANRSSGKMGMALARAALDAGARVILVRGPVEAAPPGGLEEDVRVETAEEMRAAVMARRAGADAVIMAAAVADYRVAAPSAVKLKRGAEGLSLALAPNPDILAELGRTRAAAPAQVLVGFALESEHLLAEARRKRAAKNADLIVANAAGTLGADTVDATLVRSGGEVPLGPLPKAAAAARIVREVAALLSEGARP